MNDPIEPNGHLRFPFLVNVDKERSEYGESCRLCQLRSGLLARVQLVLARCWSLCFHARQGTHWGAALSIICCLCNHHRHNRCIKRAMIFGRALVMT